jgi:hypothetical protein
MMILMFCAAAVAYTLISFMSFFVFLYRENIRTKRDWEFLLDRGNHTTLEQRQKYAEERSRIQVDLFALVVMSIFWFGPALFAVVVYPLKILYRLLGKGFSRALNRYFNLIEKKEYHTELGEAPNYRTPPEIRVLEKR